MKQSSVEKLSIYGTGICILSSLFYVYDFIIRILPGTIYQNLVLKYHMGAADLGMLSSFFFLGYISMQLPCGLLYDYFGARIIMAISLLVAAVATYFFLATDSFVVATTSRFFMGFGSAFAYIGALVLVSRWLPKKYYAFSAGIIQFMGSIGAIIGEAPVAYFVKYFGANAVVNVLAFGGGIIAVIFLIFIRNSPNTHQHLNLDRTASDFLVPLKKTLAQPQNWATACYGFFIWAPISIFAALWAVPYFKDILQLSTQKAAFIASFLWLGVAIGGPVLGSLSNFTLSRRMPLIFAAILGLVASILILYFPYLNVLGSIVLCFIFGLASSAQAVTFGLVQDNNCLQSIGTASAFNNMAIVFGGMMFQPLVGMILQWHSENALHLVESFTQNNYSTALFVLPLCYFFGLLVVLFLVKETNNRSVTLNEREVGAARTLYVQGVGHEGHIEEYKKELDKRIGAIINISRP